MSTSFYSGTLVYSEASNSTSTLKTTIFGKEIRSWRTFGWEEWFLVAATTASLLTAVALFCAFVHQQIDFADGLFTTLNIIGYCRFGFVLYYLIYGLVNEESFALLALTGSSFLQLMLASFINVVNFGTESNQNTNSKLKYSDFIELLYITSIFVTPILMIASTVLTCKYWGNSVSLLLRMNKMWMEPARKEQMEGRIRLMIKSLLAFEIQWSLICLTIVAQQLLFISSREKSKQEAEAFERSIKNFKKQESFLQTFALELLTLGFSLILLRALISWFLVGRRPWLILRCFLVILGLALVPSHFICFYLKFIEPLVCIPLTASALFLMSYIFLNHILILVVSYASSSYLDCEDQSRNSGRRFGEHFSLLSKGSDQGTAITTVNSTT